MKSALWFTGVLALSTLPCFLTRPFRDYIFVAVLWFFAVIPFFVLWNRRFRYGAVVGFLVLAFCLQLPWWQETLREQRAGWNRQRAQFLQMAAEKNEWRGVVIAESWPVFSTAFHEGVKRSVHFNLFWDDTGILRAYSERGLAVDYLLLEATPPRHLLHLIPVLRRWMESWGELVAEQGRFVLWRIKRKMGAPPGSVTVRQGLSDERIQIENSGEDNANSLVVSWDFAGKSIRDAHVYVSVDGGEFAYLGRSASSEAMRFIWRPGAADVEAAFRRGAQTGVTYRFVVYGIPPLDSVEKPLRLPPSESFCVVP